MKVTVTKYLNVRVGAPKLNAPCYQYIAPGSEIQLDGKVYKGDRYNANSNWYRDQADNYYWSGGTNKPINDKDTADLADGNLSETLKYLGVSSILSKGLSGDGITVAILDTGINSAIFKDHIDFELTRKFIDDDSYESFTDFQDNCQYSHGTKVASLISGPKIESIRTSIAPNCKFVILKIAKHKSNPKSKIISSALKFCLDNKSIDVVNMSYNSFYNKPTQTSWYGIFETLANDRLVFVSAGNEDDVMYPANSQRCMGIGGYSAETGGLIPKNKSDKIYYTLGTSIDVIDKQGKLTTANGSSFSAPIATAISVLKLEQLGGLKKSSRKIIMDGFKDSFDSESRLIDKNSINNLFN